MLKEFNEFAVRGNVLDMAVGNIIGAACNIRSLGLAAIHTGDGSKSAAG
jgi:large-conductance mechanosensitive channel